MKQHQTCKVCGAEPQEKFQFSVGGADKASFFECSRCGFLFVGVSEDPNVGYGAGVHKLDVGAVDRSLLLAGYVRSLFWRRDLKDRKILDFGGGDGLATRVLRDHGVDCRWFDPYCSPHYYVGPTVETGDKFDLIFLGEVALHFSSPLVELRRLFERSDRVLMTAVVPPKELNSDWWYLMPSTGQHIAFYSPRFLAFLAQELGTTCLSDGRFFHLFVKGSPTIWERIATRFTAVALIRWKLIEISDLFRRAIGRNSGLIESDQSVLLRALMEE